jgi:CheY-like chemotaxis protein
MDSSRKRILILDHDEQVLMDLESLLESAGFETTTTWDRQEALRLLNSRDFDLLLLGDHPREVKCVELLKVLQSRPSGPPCIVLHSVASYPFEEQYLKQLGAYAIMPRWEGSDLITKIRECLEVADCPSSVLSRGAPAG